MASTAIDVLSKELKSAHGYFIQTLDGVTDEVSAWQPAGTANPIAGIYAHLVFSEDFFVQFFLQQKQPFFETSWKDKTGISELQPTEWQEAYPKWLKTVKVSMKDAKPYMDAVFAETEKYVAALTDADLAKPIDMSAFGMGSRATDEVITSMIIAHINQILGEIAVLKGLQGLKGYPF